MHSCNQMVHSYFARYSRNRKISAKNARYLPFLSDICLYLSKSHNWGGRGRTFKSCHSDQKFRRKCTVFCGIFILFLCIANSKRVDFRLYNSTQNTFEYFWPHVWPQSVNTYENNRWKKRFRKEVLLLSPKPFSLVTATQIFMILIRSVYKELHADRETGCWQQTALCSRLGA